MPLLLRYGCGHVSGGCRFCCGRCGCAVAQVAAAVADRCPHFCPDNWKLLGFLLQVFKYRTDWCAHLEGVAAVGEGAAAVADRCAHLEEGAIIALIII